MSYTISVTKSDWVDHVRGNSSTDALEITGEVLLPPGTEAIVQPVPFTALFDTDRRHLVLHGSNVVFDFESTLTCEETDDKGDVALRVDVDGAVAVHEKFFLPEGLQGKGIGRRRLVAAAQLYRGLGVERIRLRAENIGKYAWAVFGFDFETDTTAEEVNTAVFEFARELGIEIEKPWFSSIKEIVELNVAGRDESGRPLGHFLDVDHVWDVLEARYAGDERPFWPPPRPEGDLRLGQALLLYADYDGWDGVITLS